MQKKTFSVLVTVAVAAVALSNPALAQTAQWMTPAQNGVTNLTSTLITLGGGVIGLSIVGFGLYSAMTQRLEWSKLWIYIVSGVLVTLGPTAMSWLINLFKGG